MQSRPELGLDSYDRFFPSQDTIPRGGFGNLIALPLQKHSRQHGGSVFLEGNDEPYEDQWAFLSSIHRISIQQTEEIVQKAEAMGDLLGVRRNFNPDEESLLRLVTGVLIEISETLETTKAYLKFN